MFNDDRFFDLLKDDNVTANYDYRVLDATLSASASPDCSLKMAIILSNVRIFWSFTFKLYVAFIYLLF